MHNGGVADEPSDRPGEQPRSLLAEQIRAVAERLARRASEAQRSADERTEGIQARLLDELKRLREAAAQQGEGEEPMSRTEPTEGKQPADDAGPTIAELGEQLMAEIEQFRSDATEWMSNVEQRLAQRLEERLGEAEKRLADKQPAPAAEQATEAPEVEPKLSRRARRRERRQELKLARLERDRKLAAAQSRLDERSREIEERARGAVQAAQREAEERIRSSAATTRSEIESALRAEVLAEFRAAAREAEAEARRSFEGTVEAAHARIRAADHSQEREERIRAEIESLERGAMRSVREAETRLQELMAEIRIAEQRLEAADDRVNAAEERLRGSVVELRSKRR
jgi:hypothetical protein